MRKKKKLCECGCGTEVENRFVSGHNKRGKIPWNKGLTKKTDFRVKKYGRNGSITKSENFKIGETVIWNKGLTKDNDLRVTAIKYPENRKKPTLNVKTRLKKSKLFSGKNNPNWNPNKSEFAIYKNKCKFEFNLGEFPLEFELKKVRNMFHPFKNKTGYTRDHRYSIYEGFQNKIPCEYIKHPANCELMLHQRNSKKNKESSITFEELKSKIIRWDSKYDK